MRTIPGHPKYFAAEDGTIWRDGHMLRSRDSGHGYLRVTLSDGPTLKSAYVHRLVCEAYHGRCPEKHETRHLDGSRMNNVPSNLSWSLKADNEADKVRHGTLPWGETAGQAKLTAKQVSEARSRVAAGEMIKMISTDYGISAPALAEAVRGRKWARLPGALGPRRRMLTPEEVEGVRAAVAAGEKKASVARRYGVLWGTVQRIIIGARHGPSIGARAKSVQRTA